MAVPVDSRLRRILKQFVCVRAVQMWGLDLDKYQFDGFLTWAVFFLNSDGTIYGRYGSRSESGHNADSDALISLEGFTKTLERALALHDEYTKTPDKVARVLADKTGPKRTWKRAQDIPEMETMFLTKERFGLGESRHCIHCHMVPRAEVASLHSLNLPLGDQRFWPYPLPRDIGMEMDPQEVAKVRAVQADSIAANAGLQAGDHITHINDQPILSTADIQWVLHHAKSPDTLQMSIDRGGQPLRANLPLDANWRLQMRDWRYMNQLMQGYLVNFRTWQSSSATRKELGLAVDALALDVSWVNQWKNKPASPLRDGDVIVAIDGDRTSLTVAAFTARLFRKPPGQVVRLTIIRQATQTMDVEIH